MSLLQKPEVTKTALKVLGFGDSGTGKTTFALTFPKSAITDSEDGYAFYKNNPNIALIATTKTVNGGRSYLYPLIPLNLKALSRLVFRRHKEK